MTLYEMTDAGRRLYELLQAEEIDEQTFADTLEGIGADEKIEAYCKVIREYEAEADAYEREIKRLEARKKTAENNVARMKCALIEFLRATGQDKAKGGTFSVATALTKSSDIVDAALIPDEYKVAVEPRIDKAAILKALKDGATVPGAALRETVGVRIR